MSYGPQSVLRGFVSLLWISVVVALVVGAVMTIGSMVDQPIWFDRSDPSDVFGLAAMSSLIALPIVFVCGIVLAPVVPRLFRRIGARGPIAYALLGGVTGTLTLAGLALLAREDISLLGLVSLGFPPGSTAGLLWWRAVERPSLRLSQGLSHG